MLTNRSLVVNILKAALNLFQHQPNFSVLFGLSKTSYQCSPFSAGFRQAGEECIIITNKHNF